MNIDMEYLSALNFDLEFDFLLGHCTLIRKLLQCEEEQLNGKFNMGLDKITQDHKKSYYKHFESEQYYIGELFPSIQWVAMFITAFNLFEKTINDICKVVRAMSDHNIGLQDMSGEGIERAKNYLSKVHNIAKPFSTMEWDRIKTFSKLRNVFSHTVGELDLTQRKHILVFDIAQKEELIRIENHDHLLESADIIIEDEFVFKSIEVYRKFVKALIVEIKRNSESCLLT